MRAEEEGETATIEAEFRPSRIAAAVGPAGLYIHVPFCTAICPYCDFAVTRGDERDRRTWLSALLHEIDRWSAPEVEFDTVYFGGGTPSFLPAPELAEILDRLRSRFVLASEMHVTLEANPEDVDAERVAEWRRLGVGTLSLGVQALDDQELRFLGRRHRSGRSRSAIVDAVAGGLDGASVDLIYGLPGQSLDDWTSTLERVGELGPSHLSCYELTVHEGTPFSRLPARGRFALPGDEARGPLFEITHRRLAELGYQAYEVSSFARSPGDRSRHNQKYWRHAAYLGLGPSAHSFDGRRRWWNARDWRRYAELTSRGTPIEDAEQLTDAQLRLEAVFLGLRTSAGVDVRRLREVYGYDLELTREAEIEALCARGLLSRDRQWLRPTVAGLAVADELARRLG